MAENFYVAGLTVLLAQDFFTTPEKQVLEFLLQKAKESPAVFWDVTRGREMNSDLDIIIRSIVAKCRHYNLGPIFEKLEKQYGV